MTNEDMLYTSVWEQLFPEIRHNLVLSSIEDAALHWAARKVRGHQELYEAVTEQAYEIQALEAQIKDAELETERLWTERDEVGLELEEALDRIEDLENELQEAREPEVD